MSLYLYQAKEWPNFKWNNDILIQPLVKVRSKQSLLKGYMEALGFSQRNETTLETLTLDVLKSSEIEGEILNVDEVRSSIARHLGMDIAGLVPSDRNVDGVVEMMLDATQNYNAPLTKERLFNWHSALFPTGKSGAYTIVTGDWRNDSTGPMQVVSGAIGKERVHYQAPDAAVLEKEMEQFLEWFNSEQNLDPVIKASIAHLWFVTIHPFDDGNGRIARAIADMQLTRADADKRRFYSMSAQIRLERKGYYDILEETQKANLDITAWLNWFLNCLYGALEHTEDIATRIVKKTEFWSHYNTIEINERQRLLINKLFDGFYGKLHTSKWAKIAKCSHDTALRDIQDLIDKGIFEKEVAGGRSTSYKLK